MKAKQVIKAIKFLKTCIRLIEAVFLSTFLIFFGTSVSNIHLIAAKSVKYVNNSVSLSEIVLPTVLKNASELNADGSNGYVSPSGGFIQGLPQYVQSVAGPIKTYVRTWMITSSSNEIAIEAIQTQSDSAALTAFDATLRAFGSIKGNFSSKLLGHVPKIDHSIQMVLKSTMSGVTVTVLQSVFVSRNVIFIVRMDSSKIGFTLSQLDNLSMLQNQRALEFVPPQNSNSNTTLYLVALGLLVLALLLIIMLFHFKSNRKLNSAESLATVSFDKESDEESSEGSGQSIEQNVNDSGVV